MGGAYRIHDVSNWPPDRDEVMGSKPKVWLKVPESKPPRFWLFKERHRVHTGDDWAEKIAAEVASALAIPHAVVELASRNGKRGIISRDLVSELGGQKLTTGNELLLETDPKYPSANRYGVAAHTIDRVRHFRVKSVF